MELTNAMCGGCVWKLMKFFGMCYMSRMWPIFYKLDLTSDTANVATQKPSRICARSFSYVTEFRHLESMWTWRSRSVWSFSTFCTFDWNFSFVQLLHVWSQKCSLFSHLGIKNYAYRYWKRYRLLRRTVLHLWTRNQPIEHRTEAITWQVTSVEPIKHGKGRKDRAAIKKRDFTYNTLYRMYCISVYRMYANQVQTSTRS